MSIIQQVAEWIHARPAGAISHEVAAAFGLSLTKASMVISQIHRERRFTTRTESLSLLGENGKKRYARRLYVDQVLPPQWHKTPVVGFNEATQQTVRFPSITEAQLLGGFVRVSITRCLNNSQATHGGYRWAAASHEQIG